MFLNVDQLYALHKDIQDRLTAIKLQPSLREMAQLTSDETTMDTSGAAVAEVREKWWMEVPFPPG